MSTGIGPQEASVEDEVAVAAAMQTSHADPGWRTAWEHVDATGDNHLRAVQREGQQERGFTPTLAEPHPERYSYEMAVHGEYPSLCDDPDCGPCEASEAAWRKEEAGTNEPEAGQ